MTTYFTRLIDWAAGTKYRAQDFDAEFDNVGNAFELVNDDITDINTQIDAAAMSVTTAGSNTTSTTSNSIGTGSKTWTVETGKSLVVGMHYKMADTASPSNWALGLITAYNSSTGSLTINVSDTSGSGTITAWTGSIASPITRTMTRRAVTGADTVAASDIAGLIDITSGTFTLAYTAAATLGANFWTIVWNSGSGVVTHNPNGSETIDGSATLDQYPGSVWLVHCDASNFRVVVLREPQGILHAQDSKSSGTAAQSISATTWTKRELTTAVVNTITDAAIASSVISLPAGRYRVLVNASGIHVAASAGAQRLRLRNTTDGSTLIAGVNMSVTTNAVSPTLTLQGSFTITGTKNIELQHYVGSTGGATGTAVTSGESEVYADILIERV